MGKGGEEVREGAGGEDEEGGEEGVQEAEFFVGDEGEEEGGGEGCEGEAPKDGGGGWGCGGGLGIGYEGLRGGSAGESLENANDGEW